MSCSGKACTYDPKESTRPHPRVIPQGQLPNCREFYEKRRPAIFGALAGSLILADPKGAGRAFGIATTAVPALGSLGWLVVDVGLCLTWDRALRICGA